MKRRKSYVTRAQASVRKIPRIVAVERSPKDPTQPVQTTTIIVHNPSDRPVTMSAHLSPSGAVVAHFRVHPQQSIEVDAAAIAPHAAHPERE